jgi:hypothetical protein
MFQIIWLGNFGNEIDPSTVYPNTILREINKNNGQHELQFTMSIPEIYHKVPTLEVAKKIFF